MARISLHMLLLHQAIDDALFLEFISSSQVATNRELCDQREEGGSIILTADWLTGPISAV